MPWVVVGMCSRHHACLLCCVHSMRLARLPFTVLFCLVWIDAAVVTPFHLVSERSEFANVLEEGGVQDDDGADSASATDNGQGHLMLI